MKRIALLMLLTCLAGCDGSRNDCEWLIEYRNTLAGSIANMGGSYRMEIEASFGGVLLENYKDYGCLMDIGGTGNIADMLIVINLSDETHFTVSIPEIPLLGEPHDVDFDNTSDDITVHYGKRDPDAEDVWHDIVERTSLTATIEGWIKIDEGTRCSPAINDYNCDINFECVVDDKPLVLKIAKLYH